MSVRSLRAFIGTSVFASLALLSTASAQIAAPTRVARASCPSRLDYVVLASFADSPSMLAMRAYRKPAARGP
jgi:hypothetical protein